MNVQQLRLTAKEVSEISLFKGKQGDYVNIKPLAEQWMNSIANSYLLLTKQTSYEVLQLKNN